MTLTYRERGASGTQIDAIAGNLCVATLYKASPPAKASSSKAATARSGAGRSSSPRRRPASSIRATPPLWPRPRDAWRRAGRPGWRRLVSTSASRAALRGNDVQVPAATQHLIARSTPSLTRDGDTPQPGDRSHCAVLQDTRGCLTGASGSLRRTAEPTRPGETCGRRHARTGPCRRGSRRAVPDRKADIEREARD